MEPRTLEMDAAGGRMFPLTLEGLDGATRELKRRGAYTAPHVS